MIMLGNRCSCVFAFCQAEHIAVIKSETSMENIAISAKSKGKNIKRLEKIQNRAKGFSIFSYSKKNNLRRTL